MPTTTLTHNSLTYTFEDGQLTQVAHGNRILWMWMWADAEPYPVPEQVKKMLDIRN